MAIFTLAYQWLLKAHPVFGQAKPNLGPLSAAYCAYVPLQVQCGVLFSSGSVVERAPVHC